MRTKALVVAMWALVMALGSLSASADTVTLSQLPVVGGYPSDFDPYPGVIAADDFGVSTASSITRLTWWGIYVDYDGYDYTVGDPDSVVVDDFTVQILAGDPSLLGSTTLGVVASATGSIARQLDTTYSIPDSGIYAPDSDATNIFRYDMYLPANSLVLDPTSDLGAGDSYFLMVANNTALPDGNNVDWIWWGSDTGNDHWYSSSAGSSWDPIQLDDLAFEIDLQDFTGGTAVPVPEPASLILLGLGLAGMAATRKRFNV